MVGNGRLIPAWMVRGYKAMMNDTKRQTENESGPLNILLVEDTEADAYTVQRVLGNAKGPSCTVHRATNMEEAEETLRNREDIDLILMDLGLPDTNGGEDTFHRIETVKKDIPLIVLTSVNDHELAVGFVDNGAEDYVRKGVIATNPEILCDAIDFALCRHRNKMALKERKDKEIQEKDDVINWISGNYSASG